MRPAPGLTRLTQSVVLSAFLLQATSCYSWATATAPAAGQVTERPRTVRVVRSPPGSVLTLTDALVVGDSLTGFSGTAANPVRVAVPLSEVSQIQTMKFSAARTTVLALVLTPVALAILAAISLSGTNIE